MRPIIAIVGPTATGKTDAGIRVARAVDGEIISADSMAVYRGMDIGTAKPTSVDRAAVPFHLLDVADPAQPYNVSMFKEQAAAALSDIQSRGKWPLLVGGTGLYVRVFLEDFGLTATAADATVRRRLQQEADEKGVEALFAKLKEVDPDSAARVHPNDRVRIVRALEVYEVSGRPISDQQRADAEVRKRRPAIEFGLTAPRDELYRRINERVDGMIGAGLVEEVQDLIDRGLSAESPALQSLGYKEIVSYLRDGAPLADVVEEIKRNTRRFAKRQLTWFRTDREIHWIDIHGKTADTIAQEIVSRLPT